MKSKFKSFLKRILVTLRIPTVTRISLNFELKKQFLRLKPGITLDIGAKDSPYKKYVPFVKYLRLDIDSASKPDICCDAQKIKWGGNYFDNVISVEMLEHIKDPQKAVNEIYRVLKKNGVCILSTRFVSAYHPDLSVGWGDYFRFSEEGLKYLFKDFREFHVYPHGNRIQAIWQMINQGNAGLFLNILNPLFGYVNFKDKKFPLGFVIYARK